MNQRFVPFAIAAAVFLFDRITKSVIKGHFSAWDTRIVIPNFFNIVHTENPGIAFGLLTNAPGWWRDALLIGFSGAVLIGISTMLLKSGVSGLQGGLMRTALGLVLGGAAGNLYDRIMSGTVTDFLEFHAGESYFFPAFNVADSAIFCGACLLLLDMWRSRETKSQTALDS
jgi:signal peptidase II